MTDTTTLRLLELSKLIGDRVDDVLAPRGFRFDERRRMWIRARPGGIHDGMSIPIDLPCSSEELFVTANVSVFSPGILDRLDSQKTFAERLHLASLTRNIGQLLAEGAWRQWKIADDATRDWMLGAFLAVLVDVGVAWQEQFDDLEALREGFLQFGHRDHAESTVPIVEQMIAEEQAAPISLRADSHTPSQIRRPYSRRPRPSAATVAAPLWVCDD
jgi:hypothetical protein